MCQFLLKSSVPNIHFLNWHPHFHPTVASTPSPVTEKSHCFKFPITSVQPRRNLVSESSCMSGRIMGIELPKNLLAWTRRRADDDLTESSWNELCPLLKYHGYELWEAICSTHTGCPRNCQQLPASETVFLVQT